MSKNEIAVLGLLSEKPMHGYEIHQQITCREMDYWAKIKLPSIYNTLIRLEEQGLIQSGKEKVGKMPERTVHTITAAGRAKLAELVTQLLRVEERPEWSFGLAVAFIFSAARSVVLEALHHRRQLLAQGLAALEEERRGYEGKIPFNWYMLIEAGVQHMRLELDWLDDLIEKVKTTESWNNEVQCNDCPEGGC